MDAPYKALAEPEGGVAIYYPPLEYEYFEWHYKSSDIDILSIDPISHIETSIEKIIDKLINEKFDGILGFSQGAEMVTRVLQKLTSQGQHSKDLTSTDTIKDMTKLIKYAILIGGVPPRDTSSSTLSISDENVPPRVPSLHIIGDKDEHKSLSIQLTEFYASDCRTVLTHSEDHRISSMSTGIYPKVHEWLLLQHSHL